MPPPARLSVAIWTAAVAVAVGMAAVTIVVGTVVVGVGTWPTGEEERGVSGRETSGEGLIGAGTTAMQARGAEFQTPTVTGAERETTCLVAAGPRTLRTSSDMADPGWREGSGRREVSGAATGVEAPI